jgi:hypothetical protein
MDFQEICGEIEMIEISDLWNLEEDRVAAWVERTPR